MPVVETGQIKYTERAFEEDAASAMRGKIERALIELITNADDSYALLEQKGLRVSGTIRIEIERHRLKTWKVIVRDRAEGMTLEEMKEKLCQLGGRTSGFEKGALVRGVLGRGAKDVAAFGPVTFESIKGEHYSVCRLDPRGKYELLEPTPATKSVRENVGIPAGNGTVVAIAVDPRYDAPRHSTLVEKLPAHYALRDITSDPKRNLVLVNLKDPEHKGDHLLYKYPEGKLVFEDEFEVPGYPGAGAVLRIWRARERFVEEHSPYRQGGILVKSKRAIHEVTLFGLENDPYAEWFFGKLESSYIDELIKQYDTCFEAKKSPPASNPTRLLNRQRDGLVREHPFAEALFAEAEKRLRALVEEERQRDEEQRSRVENEDTAKALRKLASAASKFMQDKLREFEIEGTGLLVPGELKASLSIVPPECIVEPGEVKTLSVLAKEELTALSGSTVALSAEGEGVDLSDTQVHLSPRKDRPDVHSGTFRARGKTPGAVCFIRGTLGHVTADAAVEVREMKEPPPVPQGLSFEHATYHIRFGRPKRLLLRARIPGQDLDAVAVKIASDSLDVLPLSMLVTLKVNSALGCHTADVFVSGKKLGGKAKIIAQLRGYLTEAKVLVGQRDIERSFPFDIKLVEDDFGPQRAMWAENNTILKITAKHASLARYLGPRDKNFPGQEKPHFKIILAEIVADQVVRRIFELREEKGRNPERDLYAIYADHQKCVGEFLPRAHELQLPSAVLKRT